MTASALLAAATASAICSSVAFSISPQSAACRDREGHRGLRVSALAHESEGVAGLIATRRCMMLGFPNQSRCYDATRRAVQFWGHDSAMEATFFVTEDALKRVQPDMRPDEAGVLGAFDANRDRIHRAAASVYVRGQGSFYILAPSDF